MAPIQSCEGAPSNTAEANLCRRCQRAAPSSTGQPVVPMVRMADSQLGRRLLCEMFLQARR